VNAHNEYREAVDALEEAKLMVKESAGKLIPSG
jgi:hypothetical protein